MQKAYILIHVHCWFGSSFMATSRMMSHSDLAPIFISRVSLQSSCMSNCMLALFTKQTEGDQIILYVSPRSQGTFANNLCNMEGSTYM